MPYGGSAECWTSFAIRRRRRCEPASVERAHRFADEFVEDADAFLPLRAEVTGVVVAGVEIALHVLAYAGVFVGDLLAELDDRLDVVLGVIREEVFEDEIGVGVATG